MPFIVSPTLQGYTQLKSCSTIYRDELTQVLFLMILLLDFVIKCQKHTNDYKEMPLKNIQHTSITDRAVHDPFVPASKNVIQIVISVRV